MPSQIDCRHGSRESLRIPGLSSDVSSPSLQKFQLSEQKNSASAELKLTYCCVLDQAERVVLPHCVTPPPVLLHV